MGIVRHYLTGFVAGEIDPLLGARVDTDQYRYGLATCTNFVPINEGPLIKRPGFELIRAADATASWLGAFRFSVTQEYVIEWCEEKARFYTNGGWITSASNVTTPYAAAEAPFLSLQQSYDRLYIDHPSHAPGALRRDTATTFTHETLDLLNGPFEDANTDESVSLTVAGTMTVGGAVTLTGALGFAAGHVGSLIYVEIEDFSAYKVWEPGMKDVTVGEYVRSAGKVYQAATAGTTGSVQPVHDSGSEWDGQSKTDINDKGPYGVRWTYVHDLFGTVKITTVTDASHAAGTVVRRLPTVSASMATWRWAHALFSDEKGWPSLVALWLGRQIHFKDFDLVASVVGDFGGGRVNFQTHSSDGLLTDDLAFRRKLQSDDPPLWIAVDRKIIAGTATREIAIGPTNSQQPVTGENISADPQSFYGSETVFPIQAGTETIFVERGGRRLRGADYDFARDRYDATDLTAAARHITKGGIVQLAYQRIPYPLVYGVRADGQLIVHPKSRLDVKGFARIELGGNAQAISAVSIVGADGKTDELWLLVERDTPAGTKREIWKQSAWRDQGDDQKEAFFVDGGVRISASAGQVSFSGLTHLASQEVAVLADGGVVPGLTVSSGGVLTLPANTAPDRAYTLIVGLGYTAEAISLRPGAQANGQWILGLKQRAVKVVTRLLETLGLDLSLPGAADAEELIERPSSGKMDEPVPLYSGDTEGLVDAEFDRNGQARWVSPDPLPAIVLGAAMKIDVDQEDA